MRGLKMTFQEVLIGTLTFVLAAQSYGRAADEAQPLKAGFSRWQQNERLAVRKVDILTADPACWKRLDIRIDLTGTFKTPFDPDEIAVDAVFRLPSGQSMTVPAFFYQSYEREVRDRFAASGNGRESTAAEILTPLGSPEWRVRFMPSEPGRYTVQIRARDRSGKISSEQTAFTARAGQGHGYVRISKTNPRYLEFDDGRPYFAIGQNVAGGPLSEFYRWLPEMARYGANFSRLWIGYPRFALELGNLGEYRLDNAWRTDQIIELSEYLGIYQLVCIEWVWYIVPRGQPHTRGFKMDDFAYSVSNGGPCKNIKDFFVLPEARRWFRNRLRYIVARWGYSPNVLAWELWNEADLIDANARQDKSLIPEWNVEMCRYLKSVDPWRHLTTNSVAFRWPEIWELKENEIAQRHGYYWDTKEQQELGKDMPKFVMRWLDDVAGYGRPYLFSEYGVKQKRGRDQDRNGVYLHEGLWTALTHGSTGTTMNWGWNNYMEPKNLYYHFRGVANFAKDIPFTTAGFEKAKVEVSPDSLRAVGQHGSQLTILWIQNKAYTFYTVLNQHTIPPVEHGEVKVAGFKPGEYRIEFWDTYEGRITGVAKTRAAKGYLRIAVPKLERDIAVKIFPSKNSSSKVKPE